MRNKSFLLQNLRKARATLRGGSGGSEGGIHSILVVEINGVVIRFNFITSVSVGDS